MRLEVWNGERRVGWLASDGNTFAFPYDPVWLAHPERFALSPFLPCTADPPQDINEHSIRVRQFFDNLLPEGQGLEDAARTFGISKANLIGLLINLGRESAGAFRIFPEGSPDPLSEDPPPREVVPTELSRRIRERPYMPISVWDARIRLSIAGVQDKVAVREHEGRWFLPDGRMSSTHLLKLEEAGHERRQLTTNEFFCMRMAKAVRLPAAIVRLAHVPEPVLVVERFDRRLRADGSIERLHTLDGCQALGLPSIHKYERIFGDNVDVRDQRHGASLPRLFGIAVAGQVPSPALERQKLLRWALFQVIVGNADAHGKNLTYFCGPEGLTLAPAYDLVSIPALEDNRLSRTFAMAIGDAFAFEDLSVFEWTEFARACGLATRMIADELQALAKRAMEQLDATADQCIAEGADPGAVAAVVHFVRQRAVLLLGMADDLRKSISPRPGQSR